MAAFIPMKIMASHPFKFMLKEEWLGILKKKEKTFKFMWREEWLEIHKIL